MTTPKRTTSESPTPSEIKKFLLERFQTLSEEDLSKMRALQSVVRKHVPEGSPLSDELIAERRKEGA